MEDTITTLKDKKVAIIGSGNIGRSFAMRFAASGYKVSMYDIDYSQLHGAMKDIKERLEELEKSGLLRGTLTITQLLQRITATDDFTGCVQGAFYIQECVFEKEQLKIDVLSKVESLMDDEAILSSSTSATIPSKLSEKLKKRDRFLVVHPTNPPFYAPLVEIVPAPWTDKEVTKKVTDLMTEIGQCPVTIKKEIDGFALNRIKGAITGECWRLIEEDVISVEDIDKVMTDGLGRRYAFMGPLETAYLNADGFYSYADRYADMIYSIQKGLGPVAKQEGELLDRVQAELEAKIPMDKLKEQRQWRDIRLAGLSKIIRDLDNL